MYFTYDSLLAFGANHVILKLLRIWNAGMLLSISDHHSHLKLRLLTHCYVSLSGVPTSKKEMR